MAYTYYPNILINLLSNMEDCIYINFDHEICDTFLLNFRILKSNFSSSATRINAFFVTDIIF